jgi:uncharacterized protein YgfB (UPF0149 family)
MFDDIDGEVAVFDFDEFANHLLEQGLEASPAELHGCLSGLLAAGAATEPELGLDALAQTLNLVLHGELAGQLMQLYTVTAGALADEEFDFHPLLPDDDADIVERTEALALWSGGFLAGFAHISAGLDKKAAALSEDSSEIMRDLAAIAQAGVDEDETEDEAEDSYIELVEFLRVAALNVYMDSQVRLEGTDLSPLQGQPLH